MSAFRVSLAALDAESPLVAFPDHLDRHRDSAGAMVGYVFIAVTSFVCSAVAGFLQARARWPRDEQLRERVFGIPPLIALIPLQLQVTNATSEFLFAAVSALFYVYGIEFWSRRFKRDD